MTVQATQATQATQPIPAPLMALMGDVGAAAAEVAERVRASVAEVRTRGGGAGAGTVWRADGTIVTNHHVLPRDHAEVTLADGRRLAASVAARDPRNDLAVLHVAAHDLPAATIGDARALRAGELVLAVGHPFGLRGALTVGVVSSALPNGAAGRARELVRADVLLGPGNSGGPLADARGRVVGINAMVVNGMALAVPSHLVERLLARRGEPPVLGIAARDVTLPPAQAARAGLPSGAAAPAVLVVDVAAGGAAERAGVLLGDVLCTLDGRRLAGTDDLLGSLEAHPGGPLHLGLLRGGVGREVVVLPPPTLREGHAGTGPEQPAPAVRQNPAQPERRAA